MHIEAGTLKALALAEHHNIPVFEYGGQYYLGTLEDAKEGHQAHQAHISELYPLQEWLDSECEFMPDYDSSYDDCYLALTDSEADILCAENIRELLWTFDSGFLFSATGIDESIFEAIECKGKCEANNEAILQLVGDGFDDLVEQAIARRGRGHFLATYDGIEFEYSPLAGEPIIYVYRIN